MLSLVSIFSVLGRDLHNAGEITATESYSRRNSSKASIRVIMSAKNVAQLFLRNSRQFSRTSTASSSEVAEGYKKLKHVQEQFQKHDGLPVHLKRGAVDKMLFGLTTVLCGVAIVGMGKLIYELSYPAPAAEDE
ncbi:cytochrome c oxidase subunit 7A, mitochondrial [Toxorhynchites rutilus septentrionalis]|uniref:cytochrome c oxidase subunit 7A, mitochondrial n=1 Tax=Toxorhynchites rutilus septentrionalis TaxID=329112 RepID=UPI00247A8DEF|nr:cytochrome c oxidase subunit 7A, mitochondrial [Toxorhynchites rutilus septentrionalis]